MPRLTKAQLAAKVAEAKELIISMTKSMDLESLFGLMEEGMKESGKMENNMVEANTRTLMVFAKKASGRMGNGYKQPQLCKIDNYSLYS